MERMLYRPEEAAEVLGISRARLYELVAAGIIPSIKVGASRRVPADALRDWIANQLTAQTTEYLARRGPTDRRTALTRLGANEHRDESPGDRR